MKLTIATAAFVMIAASLQAQTSYRSHGGSSRSPYAGRPSPMSGYGYDHRKSCDLRDAGRSYGNRGYGQFNDRGFDRHDFGRRDYTGYRSPAGYGGWGDREHREDRGARNYRAAWGGNNRPSDGERSYRQERDRSAYREDYSRQEAPAPAPVAERSSKRKESPYKPLLRNFHAAEHSIVNSAGKSLLNWATSLF